MALRGMASFDIFGTSDITEFFVSVGPGNIVAGAGRCGSAAFQGTGILGTGPAAGVAAVTRSGYTGWAYKPTGFTSTDIWSVIDLTFPCCFAIHNVDGSISLWKGVNTILGSQVCRTAPNKVLLNQYTHIGFEWLITTTGYARIYINGLLAADSGTVNMTAGFTGDGQWRAIAWAPVGYIDDLYWGDTAIEALNPYNSFLGDGRVEGQLCLTDAVGGGGTFREFGLSSGADHGAMLDENPPDDGTTYVESGTIGKKETVKFPNITLTSGTPYGIQLMPNLMKTTFAPRVIANLLYEGATETVGPDQSPAQTTFRYYPQVIAINPRTAAAWTVAQVNAAESGIKITG